MTAVRSVIGSATGRTVVYHLGGINTHRNDSLRSMLCDSSCYLTASNTCNRHFAFSLCMCLAPLGYRTTMAFAEMLSDNDIKAAVQACHGESNCTHNSIRIQSIQFSSVQFQN